MLPFGVQKRSRFFELLPAVMLSYWRLVHIWENSTHLTKASLPGMIPGSAALVRLDQWDQRLVLKGTWELSMVEEYMHCVAIESLSFVVVHWINQEGGGMRLAHGSGVK